MIDPVGLMKNHILDRILKIGNGRSAIMASSILLLFCCASCWDGTKSGKVDAAAPNKPVPIRIAKVELRQIRRDVESVGSLFPFEEVTVSSEVEGKVEQVLVDVGDRVVAGQPLVETLKEHLRDKQMLLILDNFEQVAEAAPLVSGLLAAAHRGVPS